VKIVLFENEQIFDFLLPSKPFGSFRFDKIDGEENKLINVEAQKDSWVLKSTSGIKVYDIKGNYLDSVNLKINTFYILEREENKYLIYVDSVFDNTFVKYRFNNDLNLTIGRTKKCNVFYDNEVIKGELFSLKQENDNIVLETTNHNSIYINKRKINADKITIACGDVIQCYSIIIIVLKNVILFNNPDNKIFINDLSQGLENFVI